MDLNSRNGEWMDEAPRLSETGKANPFSVPTDYFEELGSQIQARIAIEDINSDGIGFGVPAGYFESLEERIVSSVKAEEFKAEAKNHGFAVPDGYFESLESKIVDKATGRSEKDRVRRIWPAWMNYAAAACVAVTIATGAFFSGNRNSLDSRLSKVTDDEIVTYLQVSSDSGDLPVIAESINDKNISLKSDLSDKEISEYLESTL